MPTLSILRPLPDGIGAPARIFDGKRTAVHVVVLTAACAGIVVGRAEASAAHALGTEHALVVLLRFMAALKGMTALAMLGLVHWRLSRPAGNALSAGYCAATALAAAAPGLIWFLSSVGLGAILFHAGLLTFLLLAWRDDTIDIRVQRQSVSKI